MNGNLAELVGTLRLKWQPIGTAIKETNGKIKFPKLPTKPGLYRFRVRTSDGNEGVYVGETDNLQRRFAHYRNPGPTQPTNLRLNALFTELLSKGGSIEIEIVIDQAWIRWNNSELPADFGSKSVRRLFENFVLSAEKAVEIEDLNK